MGAMAVHAFVDESQRANLRLVVAVMAQAHRAIFSGVINSSEPQ
jgi:hypothetical protein